MKTIGSSRNLTSHLTHIKKIKVGRTLNMNARRQHQQNADYGQSADCWDRGRPRVKRMEEVEEYLKVLGVRRWRLVSRDQTEWQRILKQAKTWCYRLKGDGDDDVYRLPIFDCCTETRRLKIITFTAFSPQVDETFWVKGVSNGASCYCFMLFE